MRQQPPGSPTSPSGIAARYPQKTALCTKSVPPCGVPCFQPNQSVCPTGSASSSQEGPFPYFPSYSGGRKQAREKTPSLFTPRHSLPPLRPYVMPYSKQPPDSDGDFRPDLKKVFSGMGRAREGKGQFLQKTPLPYPSQDPDKNHASTGRRASMAALSKTRWLELPRKSSSRSRRAST